MKASPVYAMTHVNLSLSTDEAQRVIDNPQSVVSVIRAALEHSKTAPEISEPEPAAVRGTKAAKTAKSATSKHRGGNVAVYDCNQCDKVFTSEKRLSNHIRRAHEGDASADTDL